LDYIKGCLLVLARAKWLSGVYKTSTEYLENEHCPENVHQLKPHLRCLASLLIFITNRRPLQTGDHYKKVATSARALVTDCLFCSKWIVAIKSPTPYDPHLCACQTPNMQIGHFFSRFGEVMDVTLVLDMECVLKACAKASKLEHKRELQAHYMRMLPKECTCEVLESLLTSCVVWCVEKWCISWHC